MVFKIVCASPFAHLFDLISFILYIRMSMFFCFFFLSARKEVSIYFHTVFGQESDPSGGGDNISGGYIQGLRLVGAFRTSPIDSLYVGTYEPSFSANVQSVLCSMLPRLSRGVL